MQNPINTQTLPNPIETTNVHLFLSLLANHPLYKSLSPEVKETFAYDPKEKCFAREKGKIKFNFKKFNNNPQPKQSTKCKNILKDKAYICFDCRNHS